MDYSGLVSSEHTSGNRVQRGAITKSGNAHLRRVFVEAAWTYRHRPNLQGRVLGRQKSPALDEEAEQIAWKAQQRLHRRFAALTARGKENNVAAIAVARELLGFIWAIAVHTEAQHKPTPHKSAKAAQTVMSYWTAAPMAVEGPRKGEPSRRIMRYGLRTQPRH